MTYGPDHANIVLEFHSLQEDARNVGLSLKALDGRFSISKPPATYPFWACDRIEELRGYLAGYTEAYESIRGIEVVKP